MTFANNSDSTVHISDLNDPLLTSISDSLGRTISKFTPLSQSTSGPTARISCGEGRYFLKFSSDSDVLVAEYDGLFALANSTTIRVPKPIIVETFDTTTVLVSEYIELTGQRTDYLTLASSLFALHSHHGARYGWHRDNYIGRSHQVNSQCDDWSEFFLNYRLIFQLEMAWRNGYSGNFRLLGEKMPDAVSTILKDHHPPPSLLHGDLWSGNYGFDSRGEPVIIDPAVYHGDAETDLAMMQLFGSPPTSFFNQYQELKPLPDGWQLRKSVYNLYHILNHLNIFGSSYRSHAESLMDSILREVH